jgi:hypothetical protein
MLLRPLTLPEVTDALLAESGLWRGATTDVSYRCADPSAVLLPLSGFVDLNIGF